MNYKRILAMALSLCLAVPMTTVIPEICTSAADVVVSNVRFSGIYQYKDCGDHIEIMATSTTAEGTVEVPAEIDGLPVTTIGEHGLAGLSKVTSIKLPDTITTIGKQAFAYNTTLESINIPENVRIIPDEAFMNCMSLGNVTIPDKVMSIGVRAFYGCKSLTSIDIPESVTEISNQAFDSCSGLTSIEIPKNVTVINDGVFSYCKGITEMTLHENITSVGTMSLPSSLERLTIENPDCDLSQLMTSISSKKCTLLVMPDSTAVEFAEKYGYTWYYRDDIDVEVMGDVNYDWEFNIADVVMMQNYLLGNGSLTEWQLGDMNNDGEIDVFDYIIMRQELPNSPELNPPYVPENPDPNLDYTAKNLTVDIQSKEVTGAEADEEFITSQTEFALELFRSELKEDENTLVSPYSVMQALAMTANGADGSTKTEMEDVLGMSMDKLNKYLYTQSTSQHSDENSKLSTANSIWAINGLDVNKDFLQTNVDYYNADFFTAPFDDTTVTDINNWVNDKTDEMIPEVLEEIPPNAIMYLINAVAFDAKWEVEFNKDMTVKADFTAIDNKVQEVDMMYNDEECAYHLKDDNAEGIYKYYKDRKYAFVAMMPNEGVSITDYVANLKADSLIADTAKKLVGVKMPKFSYDFNTELTETLSAMGMPSAFDRMNADFSNMVSGLDGPTYISSVIHKTHIDVDEAGTKAAAVTVVEVSNDCVPLPVEIITFDRPFVYFIIDTETNIPVFMGTLMSIDS